MNLKKAFTLAEIMIVMTVLGVIAAMTIPSVVTSTAETHYRTAYKKAFENVSRIFAEDVTSTTITPAKSSAESFFKTMIDKLSIKSIVSLNDGVLLTKTTATIPSLKFSSDDCLPIKSCPDGTVNVDLSSKGLSTPWIVTDDEMAYKLIRTSDEATCSTKFEINNQSNYAATLSNSCFVIEVDVDGLTKGKNILESQTSSTSSAKDLDKFTGDRFYIFVGSDGATGGNEKVNISGRILSDMK